MAASVKNPRALINVSVWQLCVIEKALELLKDTNTVQKESLDVLMNKVHNSKVF